ncbi:DUF6527 family protein [Domibacillus epiphyticus]|uniref:Uncharacterized protein n=1 Tax=Domibacillus epiphyticus TaxID=1714355 RepID=A0A1V2ACJ2_9BACI|nr:DUF6527 family protein [Domibacillus epiphyticus]OMP68715.1 hypothetical protein BTO28_01310 [Domibacillus epiphyticus]
MRLVNLFEKITNLIKRIFSTSKSKIYRSIYLTELPDNLSKDTIYILGEGKYLWSAALICPCGCQELLQISLHKDGRPKWEIAQHNDGTVSLHPSIWRQKGCRSHFWLKKGQIHWCED